MIQFFGGPAAGIILQLRRAPIMLRVVLEGTKWDALNEPADVAAPREAIYLYRLSERPTPIHLCIRGKRRAEGGLWQMGKYHFLPDQPSDEILRDNVKYAAWCEANRALLMPEWAKGIVTDDSKT